MPALSKGGCRVPRVHVSSAAGTWASSPHARKPQRPWAYTVSCMAVPLHASSGAKAEPSPSTPRLMAVSPSASKAGARACYAPSRAGGKVAAAPRGSAMPVATIACDASSAATKTSSSSATASPTMARTVGTSATTTPFASAPTLSSSTAPLPLLRCPCRCHPHRARDAIGHLQAQPLLASRLPRPRARPHPWLIAPPHAQQAMHAPQARRHHCWRRRRLLCRPARHRHAPN